MSGDVSRIMMNFDGSQDSVSTLAHELGHAFHNVTLAERTPLQRRLPMALAETASIFCETLLFEHAAAGATDDAERLALLDVHLVGATQTVVDIHSRFLFETELCTRRRRTTLSVADMKAAMLDAQDAAYGDGLDPAARHEYMWAVKGHYFTPFYNWPYTFGLLFGIGLYARYVDDPDAFRSGYDDLLSTVGMADASSLAARFGFDIRERAFWADSLAVVERHVDDYERLAKRLPRETRAGACPRVLGLAVAIVCSVIVATVAPAGAAPAWTFVPTAPGAAYGHLNDVSCPTASVCFAVGGQDSNGVVGKFIERWNGSKWSVAATSKPAGAGSSTFTAVQCVSTVSCVAVGQYNTPGRVKTMIQRWDGHTWAIQPSPNVAASPISSLAGVHCTSAASCFAVGVSYASTATSAAQSTLIERWDGATWSIAPSPNQPFANDSSLAGVSCVNATSCFAVGNYDTNTLTNTLVEHWDGAAWTIMPSPNPSTAGSASCRGSRASAAACASRSARRTSRSSSVSTARRGRSSPAPTPRVRHR